jgi:hypothetical protein
MGIVGMGVPEVITLELARLAGATVFVETGTFRGGTTRWAAGHFPVVFTIERAEGLYLQQRDALARLPGVTPLLGDSRTVLPAIVAGLGDRRAVYWLDGHWCAGETAGADDECPLLDELACLANRRQDLILVDDARLFLCAPPRPHHAEAWPTLPQIVDALSGSRSRPYIQVIDDVLFAIPDEEPLRSCLTDYAQSMAGEISKGMAAMRKSYRRRSLGHLISKVKAWSRG